MFDVEQYKGIFAMNDTDLLLNAFRHIDVALGYISEITGGHGKALYNILHGGYELAQMIHGESVATPVAPIEPQNDK